MRTDVERESGWSSTETQTSGGEFSGGSGGHGVPYTQLQSEVDQDTQILENQKIIKFAVVAGILYYLGFF